MVRKERRRKQDPNVCSYVVKVYSDFKVNFMALAQGLESGSNESKQAALLASKEAHLAVDGVSLSQVNSVHLLVKLAQRACQQGIEAAKREGLPLPHLCVVLTARTNNDGNAVAIAV